MIANCRSVVVLPGECGVAGEVSEWQDMLTSKLMKS
jgi:hypothetical protein